MADQTPYVSRKQSEDFLNEFANALEHPESYPLLFHVWGIGGVGKTTLLRKLQEVHKQQASFADISFSLTVGIETPLKLMAKLYEQLPKPGVWQQQPDPFTSLYDKYLETAQQLKTQPAEGEKSINVEPLKKLLSLATSAGASASGLPMPPGVVEGGVDAAMNLQ